MKGQIDELKKLLSLEVGVGKGQETIVFLRVT